MSLPHRIKIEPIINGARAAVKRKMKGVRKKLCVNNVVTLRGCA